MTREELQNFINDNDEHIELEYKLKPNFDDIETAINHITKRIYFKILKAIYALANTKGGVLYIGIGEDKKNRKRTIVGVDDCDQKQIDSIFKKIHPKITIKKEFIKLEPEKREVIKITVDKLKLYDKPQLLNGVLYIRKKINEKDAETKTATTEEWIKIYFESYPYWLDSVRDNIYKVKNEQDNFVVKQFITGLKGHIKRFANENDITDKEIIKNAEKILDNIQTGISEIKLLKATPEAKQEKPVDIDKAIDDFIKTYKAIIDMGV